MEAVFDADLHLDAVVQLWVVCERLHCDVLLLHKIRDALHDSHSQKVPEQNKQTLYITDTYMYMYMYTVASCKFGKFASPQSHVGACV